MKRWYNIYSPPYFGEVLLGSVPSKSPGEMLSRVIEATLYDLTGDYSQQNIKLIFKVTEVKENDCSTIFNGHEYSRDYLRSLVRRGSSRVDSILDLTTKDGHKMRVTVVIFTLVRVVNSKVLTLRSISRDIVEEKSKQLNLDQFAQETVLGKIASDIYNESKKITPLRHVGIVKSKLVDIPTDTLQEEIVEAIT